VAWYQANRIDYVFGFARNSRLKGAPDGVFRDSAIERSTVEPEAAGRQHIRLAIVTRTAKEKPKHATRMSARMLTAEIGVGHTTVQRARKEHGLKPHVSRPFKLCRALPQPARQGGCALRRREWLGLGRQRNGLAAQCFELDGTDVPIREGAAHE
jgi:hypothetical protein